MYNELTKLTISDGGSGFLAETYITFIKTRIWGKTNDILIQQINTVNVKKAIIYQPLTGTL